MLKRFLKLNHQLPKLEIDEIDRLLPNPVEVRTLEGLCDTFVQLDAVTKKLQEDTVTLADVRAIFDTVIEEFPNAKPFLSQRAQSIEEKFCFFESGIVKILNN